MVTELNVGVFWNFVLTYLICIIIFVILCVYSGPIEFDASNLKFFLQKLRGGESA